VLKDDKGEPWWVAKDVCDALWIVPHEAYKRLQKSEKAKKGLTFFSSNSAKQKRNYVIVNEPGLYRLIFSGFFVG
jgi:prophage antirepressor-like protein